MIQILLGLSYSPLIQPTVGAGVTWMFTHQTVGIWAWGN